MNTNMHNDPKFNKYYQKHLKCLKLSGFRPDANIQEKHCKTTPDVKAKKNGGFGWFGFNMDSTFF